MQKKVSLVLSGGGARGLAHIGVIEELEKAGYEIHSVVGTSMGALVGGMYAMGELESFKNWMTSLDKMKVFNLVDFTISSHGLVKGDKVFSRMQELIPDQDIENFPKYFAALSVDLIKRDEVKFEKGSFYTAARASMAIPNVMKPVKTKNQILVDGGVMNNLPMLHAHRIEGDLLVAVDVGANVPVISTALTVKEAKEEQSKYQKKVNEFYQRFQKWIPFDQADEESKKEKLGYLDLMNSTVDLMMEQQTKLQILNNPPDVLIQISRDSCGTYDFYRTAEMIEIGRKAFQNQWKK
jgi:NTE family protein